MLGNKKGKMICGYVPDYVLFDLETTGTSCIYDEVIEISAVKVRSGKVVEMCIRDRYYLVSWKVLQNGFQSAAQDI